jgi:hypothetical protein
MCLTVSSSSGQAGHCEGLCQRAAGGQQQMAPVCRPNTAPAGGLAAHLDQATRPTGKGPGAGLCRVFLPIRARSSKTAGVERIPNFRPMAGVVRSSQTILPPPSTVWHASCRRTPTHLTAADPASARACAQGWLQHAGRWERCLRATAAPHVPVGRPAAPAQQPSARTLAPRKRRTRLLRDSCAREVPTSGQQVRGCMAAVVAGPPSALAARARAQRHAPAALLPVVSCVRVGHGRAASQERQPRHMLLQHACAASLPEHCALLAACCCCCCT